MLALGNKAVMLMCNVNPKANWSSQSASAHTAIHQKLSYSLSLILFLFVLHSSYFTPAQPNPH